MPRLTIDAKTVEVATGTTILQAARSIGIEIPTLCFADGLEPATSCMLCVVKIAGEKGLVPACAAQVVDGMDVITDDQELRQARQVALELLLSDHIGDCMAPCQLACPAHMEIPAMIRAIANGDLDEAIRIVRSAIAMPAVVGRICQAPCQKACRRGKVDAPLAIRLLERLVADLDLQRGYRYTPKVSVCPRPNQVAVVGAGPAGLAAAYYLAQAGIKVTIFDQQPLPGGGLRYGLAGQALPEQVLDAEIASILKLGPVFKMGLQLGRDLSLEQLRSSFDAVLLAIGASAKDQAAGLGLSAGKDGLVADKQTSQTELAGVFVAGDALRPRRMAIRSLAEGRYAAACIQQYLEGKPIEGIRLPFNCHMGQIDPDVLTQMMALASKAAQVRPSDGQAGLSWDQGQQEAARCLHCDCRKAQTCRLRHYAELYKADQLGFKGSKRAFALILEHPELVYEPGKCINCGICVRITRACGERYGLTFVGRGFDMKVAVPFGRPLGQGLEACVGRCVEACPTGALAWRKG